ncbi:hypothetical protein JOB18_005208 [Solea senegalensis]|uniref:Uncharacterized protein n=1 Tax=Solea senegalensis TaxID=28829 RepID=A0AAV6QRQ6_SOLSE|nr:hypothetical protein JOB18_005208 [Solea senegalensis]
MLFSSSLSFEATDISDSSSSQAHGGEELTPDCCCEVEMNHKVAMDLQPATFHNRSPLMPETVFGKGDCHDDLDDAVLLTNMLNGVGMVTHSAKRICRNHEHQVSNPLVILWSSSGCPLVVVVWSSSGRPVMKPKLSTAAENQRRTSVELKTKRLDELLDNTKLCSVGVVIRSGPHAERNTVVFFCVCDGMLQAKLRRRVAPKWERGASRGFATAEKNMLGYDERNHPSCVHIIRLPHCCMAEAGGRQMMDQLDEMGTLCSHSCTCSTITAVVCG